MKKFTVLLILLVVGFSFALPVFAQEGKPQEGMAMREMGGPYFMGMKGFEGRYYSPEEVAKYDEDTKAAWREIQEYKIRKENSHFMAFAAAVAIGLAALGGALGQGRAAASALEGIARNPDASAKIFTPLIISLALIESLVIYALVIAFLLQGKM